MKVRYPRKDRVLHSKRWYPIPRVSQSKREGPPKRGTGKRREQFQGREFKEKHGDIRLVSRDFETIDPVEEFYLVANVLKAFVKRSRDRIRRLKGDLTFFT